MEVQDNNKKYITVDIEIKNLTDKDISNIEGWMNLFLNDEKYTARFSYDKVLPAKESVIIESYLPAFFDYSSQNVGVYNDTAHLVFYGKEPQNIKCDFELKSVIYSKKVVD